jgi:hypothetical protein
LGDKDEIQLEIDQEQSVFDSDFEDGDEEKLKQEEE